MKGFESFVPIEALSDLLGSAIVGVIEVLSAALTATICTFV